METIKDTPRKKMKRKTKRAIAARRRATGRKNQQTGSPNTKTISDKQVKKSLRRMSIDFMSDEVKRMSMLAAEASSSKKTADTRRNKKNKRSSTLRQQVRPSKERRLGGA